MGPFEKKSSFSQFTIKHELKRIVAEEWGKIDPLICKNLVNSMQRRCKSVIKSGVIHPGFKFSFSEKFRSSILFILFFCVQTRMFQGNV